LCACLLLVRMTTALFHVKTRQRCSRGTGEVQSWNFANITPLLEK
jgi:hypothetical protein